MRIAVEVWSADAEQVIATARRAEALGLDGFYYGESPTGLNVDCWTMLAALARETERIRLGPVITNVLDGYRSLALLAKQAATVAVLSEGRLDFRTGVGAARRFGSPWWEPFGVHYGGYEERLAALGRALDVLPLLWQGERVTLAPGQEPIALGFDCPPIPITLAATGRRAVRLAHDRADVWELSFCTPDEVRARLQRRPPVGRPTVSLEIDGFIGTTAERAAAVRDRAEADRAEEDLGPAFERALLGTPEEAHVHLQTLAEAGVARLVVALHDPHDPDALTALSELTAENNHGPR